MCLDLIDGRGLALAGGLPSDAAGPSATWVSGGKGELKSGCAAIAGVKGAGAWSLSLQLGLGRYLGDRLARLLDLVIHGLVERREWRKQVRLRCCSWVEIRFRGNYQSVSNCWLSGWLFG